MSISMYQVSIPVCIRMLTNLGGILDKAAAHAQARKIDPAVLLGSRLYPDMLPLSRQVQIAADTAKGVARLAGLEPPRHEDNEQSFPELTARLGKTIAFLETLKPDQFDGAESRTVAIKRGEQTLTYDGQTYLLTRVLPNLFFHITTTYGILRHNGVEIGKKDYLGRG